MNYESLPRAYTLTPANVNTSGFASGVSGATWPLTATVSGDSLAHQVTIANQTANTHVGQTITIVGLDQNGQPATETITGPAGNATVTSTLYYSSLTSVTPSATFGADTVNIGWNNVIAYATINVNYMAEDILSLLATVTGTINFTINQTLDKIGFTGTPAITPTWMAVASSQTAGGTVYQTTGGATAIQIIVNSYSNGAVLKINANPTFVANATSTGGVDTNVNLAQVGGSAVSLGLKTSAGSIPVVIASDQGALPTNITQIKGVALSVGNGTTDTGTQRVTLSSDSTGTMIVTQATAANLNATAAQGAPATLANAWPEKITDGTNGPVAVKAASTAAVATDPALTVAISPNGQLPAGQAGSANSVPVVIANDQSAVAVKGNAAAGSAVSGNPLLVAGTDGTNARTILTDTSGRQQVAGAGAAGSAVAGNPILVAGSDGTNARTLATDTSGNPTVVGNVASGSADSGNPVKVGARYNASSITLSDGQRGDLQLDTGGHLLTVPQFTSAAIADGSSNSINVFTGRAGTTTSGVVTTISAYGSLYNGATWDRARSGGVTGIAGVSPQATPSGGASVAHISTSTTTTVKSGSGTLYAIIVNSLGTVASTTTIYDSTTGSGTVLGVINTLALSGPFEYGPVGGAFTTGLTIVTTGTVAPDITVLWK